MRAAVHAEWTKLRTVTEFSLLPLAAIVATVGLSAAAARACANGNCGSDPVRTALTGVQLGQAVVALLAVTVFASEYGTGLIRPTLVAMPRRGVVLMAKAATVAAVVTATGVAAVAGALLVADLLLPGPLKPAADGPVLRAAAGSVLYLTLVALLGLGIAAVVRDTAAATGVVLGLLYVAPLLIRVIGDERWQQRLGRIAPSVAGLAIQSTRPDGQPIGPWTGLGVLALWSAAALLAAWASLRMRDA